MAETVSKEEEKIHEELLNRKKELLRLLSTDIKTHSVDTFSRLEVVSLEGLQIEYRIKLS